MVTKGIKRFINKMRLALGGTIKPNRLQSKADLVHTDSTPDYEDEFLWAVFYSPITEEQIKIAHKVMEERSLAVLRMTNENREEIAVFYRK